MPSITNDGISVASQVARQLKTQDLKDEENISKL